MKKTFICLIVLCLPTLLIAQEQQVTVAEATSVAVTRVKAQTASAEGRGADPLRYRPAEADRRTEGEQVIY